MSAPSPARTAHRRLPTGTILPVAGVSHRQDDVRTVNVDEPLVLRHDVNNPRDRWAVRVETSDGRVLGYVPAKNDLNVRLAANTPGGIWHATVLEVLRGDDMPWGLRIRLGELIGCTDGTFGATVPGLRHSGDGYDEVSLRTAPVPGTGTAGDPTAAGEVAMVFSPAGRQLGRLLERAGTRVRVQTTAGVVAYPEHAVRIR